MYIYVRYTIHTEEREKVHVFTYMTSLPSFHRTTVITTQHHAFAGRPFCLFFLFFVIFKKAWFFSQSEKM